MYVGCLRSAFGQLISRLRVIKTSAVCLRSFVLRHLVFVPSAPTRPPIPQPPFKKTGSPFLPLLSLRSRTPDVVALRRGRRPPPAAVRGLLRPTPARPPARWRALLPHTRFKIHRFSPTPNHVAPPRRRTPPHPVPSASSRPPFRPRRHPHPAAGLSRPSSAPSQSSIRVPGRRLRRPHRAAASSPAEPRPGRFGRRSTPRSRSIPGHHPRL